MYVCRAHLNLAGDCLARDEIVSLSPSLSSSLDRPAIRLHGRFDDWSWYCHVYDLHG